MIYAQVKSNQKLETVKPGDKVILWDGGFYPFPSLIPVEKVHKLHIIVGGRKFNVKGGRIVPRRVSGYSSDPHIEAATEANLKDMNTRLAEIADQRLMSSLREIVWREQPIEIVRQVAEIVGLRNKVKTDEPRLS